MWQRTFIGETMTICEHELRLRKSDNTMECQNPLCEFWLNKVDYDFLIEKGKAEALAEIGNQGQSFSKDVSADLDHLIADRVKAERTRVLDDLKKKLCWRKADDNFGDFAIIRKGDLE